MKIRKTFYNLQFEHSHQPYKCQQSASPHPHYYVWQPNVKLSVKEKQQQ